MSSRYRVKPGLENIVGPAMEELMRLSVTFELVCTATERKVGPGMSMSRTVGRRFCGSGKARAVSHVLGVRHGLRRRMGTALILAAIPRGTQTEG